MKIRPVEDKLFQEDRRTDGRTDMTKPIITFRNVANVPKNVTRYVCVQGY